MIPIQRKKADPQDLLRFDLLKLSPAVPGMPPMTHHHKIKLIQRKTDTALSYADRCIDHIAVSRYQLALHPALALQKYFFVSQLHTDHLLPHQLIHKNMFNILPGDFSARSIGGRINKPLLMNDKGGFLPDHLDQTVTEA